MQWLHEHAQVVSLDDLLDTTNPGGLRVALSFDDGYETLYSKALPALSDYGFAAIAYLNSGRIGEDAHRPSDPAQGHYPGEHFLLWSEVAALLAAGWQVGGHGVEHLDLTTLDQPQVADQIARCKFEIESRLRHPCEHFAYTWGHYNAQARQAVVAANYRSAVAGLHGPVRTRSDRHALPRIDVRAEYDVDDFADIVLGRWDFLRLKQSVDQWLR
jgi:peptidoglycan/xylan/chitin deacetylase (PgdA/CDA1 family)